MRVSHEPVRGVPIYEFGRVAPVAYVYDQEGPGEPTPKYAPIQRWVPAKGWVIVTVDAAGVVATRSICTTYGIGANSGETIRLNTVQTT